MIKETQERVKKLMEDYPHLRDSDGELIYSIWAEECQSRGLHADAFTILSMFRRGELTSTDAITRARRKVEEHNEHLRGKTYANRQVKGAQVKEEIIEISHEGDLSYLLKGTTP